MAYGSIYSKSDVRNALLDANKLYKSTYDTIDSTAAKQYYDIDKYEQVAIEALNSSYNQALSQYNMSAEQTKQSIYGSDLGSNYKSSLIEQNKKAMQDAYASYRQNYASNLSNLSTELQNGRSAIAENVSPARSEVDAALDNDVKFAQMYDDAYYDYLSYLWENNPQLFDDERYSQYIGTDENGYISVKSKAELVAPGGPLYDTSGNLTDAGKDFIRLLENDNQGKYSFGSYLAGNKNYTDLLNWAMSSSDITGETNRDKVLKNIYGIGPDEIASFDDNGKKYDINQNVAFYNDDIVTYDSPTIANKSWYVSPDELKGDGRIFKFENGITPDKYLAKYGKHDDAVDVVNDIKRGIVKDGTIFKRGNKKFMYQDGTIYSVNVTNPNSATDIALEAFNMSMRQTPWSV